MFFQQCSVNFLNCSVGSVWLLGSIGGDSGPWPNPDSATSPIVANRGAFMDLECEFFALGASGNMGGSFVFVNGAGFHGNGVNDLLLIGGGATVLVVEGKDLQGIGAGAGAAGVRVVEGGTLITEGNTARAGSISLEGPAGDLIVTAGIPTAVPYGIGVGDFEEVLGWNGHLQRFPSAPGDLGDSSLITTRRF